MSEYVYDLCGVNLRSNLELHLPAATCSTWDVDIVWGDHADTSEPPDGEVVASLDLAGNAAIDDQDSESDGLDIGPGWWYRAVRIGEGYLVRFHRCGEFRVSADLAHVEVRPDPAGRHEILPILMAGTVGSMLLAWRGNTVLHASAVAIGGRALAFVAPSGGGKSTLAALLCQQGASLVTDDVLVIEAGPPPQCSGGAAELRLRPAAATLAHSDHGSSRPTADGRTAFAPGPALRGPLPLGAIILPWPSREASELVVNELTGAERLLAVMENPRVFGWAEHAVLARDLLTLGKVVNTVPVLQVTVPWGPPFDPLVANELLNLVR